jgi:hypothetical protein
MKWIMQLTVINFHVNKNARKLKLINKIKTQLIRLRWLCVSDRTAGVYIRYKNTLECLFA